MDEISTNVDAEVERRIGRLGTENAAAKAERDAVEARAAQNLIDAAEKIEKLATRFSDMDQG